MSALKWSLKHKARSHDVKELVTALGFLPIPGKDNLYVQKVSSGTHWREFKVRVKFEEVLCFMYNEEEYTTESYYEYLIQSGYLMGQIASKLELLPAMKEGEEVRGAQDDDEEEELAGEDMK